MAKKRYRIVVEFDGYDYQSKIIYAEVVIKVGGNPWGKRSWGNCTVTRMPPEECYGKIGKSTNNGSTKLPLDIKVFDKYDRR